MAWNEPDDDKNRDKWNGSKKQQNPPDLDEALRKLSRKLKTLLKQRPASGGSTDKLTPGNFGTIGISLVLTAIFTVWVLAGIYIVGPAEQAVVLRFGRYIKTVGPGPHWIPRIIDTKTVVNVQKVSNFSYKADMLNKDENIVSVSVAIQFRIAEPNHFLYNVVNPIESLQQATASTLRQVIGHTTLDEILTVGREKVRQQVSNELKTILAIYKTGIEITDVAMQPARAPHEVKEAFDDAIKAQEDEQRFINQALAYAARVEPIAEGNAKRTIQEANAYKQQVVLQAKGDVSRFLALLPQFTKYPKVTRERLYLDAVESVLHNTRKILVDVKGSNNMFYLPLDKLMQTAKLDTVNKNVDVKTQSQVDNKISETARAITDRLRQPMSDGRARMGRDDYQGRGNY